MINYIGGLKRSFDYAKIPGSDNQEGYQAAMVILRHNSPGKSFWITRDALWKYIEPKDNWDEKTIAADMEDFNKIVSNNMFARKIAVTFTQKGKAAANAACISFAVTLNKTTGIMLCTGYNLGKCMQMFNITPCPEAAAQLLLWIQDGLDQLKNMPDAPEEDKLIAGEVTLFDGGTKIGTKDIEVTESELTVESNEASL